MIDVESILNEENLLFYDIEVFKEDSLVVFKNIKNETVAIFHNDFNGMREVIKSKTLVGFNNYYYDDSVLDVMLKNWVQREIKERNDKLIRGETVPATAFIAENITLDCFQQIDVSKPSLKKIEANMGENIHESAIDFTIDRKLTEDELKETIEYCAYDVEMTIEIYKLRVKSYFEPKLNIIKMLNEKIQKKAIRWNTTTISANLVADSKPVKQWSDVRLGEFRKDGDYEMFELVPETVKSFWLANYHEDKGKFVHEEFGCKIEFGFGGLHGVPIMNKGKYTNVKMLDVASLYPNIINKLRVLGERTDFYQENLVEKRLSVKHTDKTLSSALKLVINSVYGLLRSDYSLLKNKMGAISVCIYGQIILYDLCKRLAPTCEIININTDGVGFTTSVDDYLKVWKEWEQDYGFTLELDEFDVLIQKDVNNYLAVSPDGSVKAKGGEVGRYKYENVFKNNSNRIVDIAIAEKLLHDVEPLDTILQNLDKPKLFQQVLQAGSTYKGTYDREGNKYQKVNRVFPVKRNGVQLYKKRVDDGMVMFPDAPEQMLVWNDNVENMEDFRSKVDINYYYQLINKKLERWIV